MRPVASSRLFMILFVFFALATLIPHNADAQVSADPFNSIYEWFDIWEGRGYITQMPVFRPYPENVVLQALRRVAEVGDPESRRVAQEWIERLDVRFDREFQLISELRTLDGEDFHAKGAIALEAHGRLGENVTVAGGIAGVLLDVEDGELLPNGERTERDLPDDWSKITVAGRDLAALNQINSSFVWGSESLYLHTGIMRRSFGPFHDDGIVWSPYARQSPGIITSWRVRNFRFTAGLFALTATQLYQERTPFNEDDANVDVIADIPGAEFYLDPDEFPGKWVFLQDFRWQPLSWLTLAFFESVTWGPRFELTYLTPLKWTYSAQNGLGDVDSSKIGLSVVGRPRRDLQVPFVVYVDDASFNDLAQFDFDTKLKLGVHTGAIWTPEHSLLRRVRLDYLALFPYMYTHDERSGVYAPEPNYTNYTHQGSSLGPGLEPNSDRVELETSFAPLPRLTTTLTGTVIRHANASEGIEGLNLANNDGTITDDGRYYHFFVDGTDIYIERGRLSYQEDLRFLDQENIETVFQAGLELAYRIPLRARTSITMRAGYVFEYVRDPISWEPTGATAPGTQREDTDPAPPDVVVYDVVTGPDQTNHYGNLTVTFSF